MDDGWEDYREYNVGDSVYVRPTTTLKSEVDQPARRIKRLLGPRGETLRTFSDKPPVGFHQGERGR